ncbi:MAG: sigma 54-interacting transcriptional regulator [Gemmatimonadota bacterium]
MSPIAVVWSAVAGASFAIAFVEGLVWLRLRRVWAHVFLALVALATGLVALCELWAMTADAPADIIGAIRWGTAAVVVLQIALMAYVLLHLKVGRWWLAVGVVVTRGIDLVLNFAMPATAKFQGGIESLRESEAFGVTFVLPQGEPSPWMAVGYVGNFLMFLFLVDAAVRVWRERGRWPERALAASFVLAAVLATTQAFLIEWNVLGDVPYTLSLFFQPILFAMVWSQSEEVVRAARLASDLLESEERLRLASDAAGFGVWEWDGSHDRILATPRWHRLFGFEPDQAVTFDDVIERIHPDDRKTVVNDLGRSEAGLGDFAGEFRLVLPDGTRRWINSRGRVVGDGPDGNGRHMLGAALDVTVRRTMEEDLRGTLEEVERLREKVEMENVALREAVRRREDETDAIVGESEPVLEMLALARKVAPTESAVLLTGETGTGKELLAQAIHDMSGRRERVMVKVNCAALPASLIESELFGRERGAYTGATTRQMGRFELADKSTLLLDEVGELPLELQAKLLRVLEDGTFERLGSTRTLTTDVRVIAATNRDLPALVAEGTFREDLYHRLNVFPIHLPALRDRPTDIPLLVWKFIDEFNRKMGKSIDQISKSAWQDLQRYPWPGNVRELRNLVERAVILSSGRALTIALPPTSSAESAAPLTLAEAERRHILQVLDVTGWRISGDEGAADILGIPPTTLHSRMKKLGIVRPKTGR